MSIGRNFTVRRRAGSALALAVLALPFFAAEATAAVFIVRHAEKQSDANEKEVPLSDAGRARAKRLAETLRDSRITAIYSTDTVRTLSTAEPLARAAKLAPILYSASGADGKVDLSALAERIRREHPSDNVLVVGHSNTIAPLIRALGSAEEVTVGAQEYDGLWIVVPQPPAAASASSGEAVLLRLRQ